ncbi:MAG TPA: hypothetical protein VG712_01950, partial [Gemmatimonadales bacterium]|nr:hypothetical protein [Gemmatimonadales bacterium]
MAFPTAPALPLRAARLALLALVVSACAAPDDVSDEYKVLLDPGPSLVYRGDAIGVRASLYHIQGNDTTYVPNTVLVWRAGGEVEIEAFPDGYANVFGLRRGATWLYVYAPAYGGDDGDGRNIRVADEVELDTVVNTTVAWGGRLTLRGVRVGNPADVSVRLNGLQLIPDTLSLVGDADQVEEMKYFVPAGASSGIVQLTGFGLIATDSTPVTVVEQELFEPNDVAPTAVQLDTAQPYPAVDDPPTPGHPEIRFFEPLLLYETPGASDSISTDWFHFVSDTGNAHPWTFVFRSSAIPRRGAFGVPATLTGGVPVFDAGAFGFDFDLHRTIARCRGDELSFPVVGGVDSVVLSLRTLPVSGIDFVEYSSNSGEFGLGVFAGYRPPASFSPGHDVAPDPFEDNDFCEQADANFLIDSLKVDLGAAPLSENLTIDTPFELDWIRFHVAADGPVVVRTAARGGFAGAALDLYLFRQSDLDPRGGATGAGGA